MPGSKPSSLHSLLGAVRPRRRRHEDSQRNKQNNADLNPDNLKHQTQRLPGPEDHSGTNDHRSSSNNNIVPHGLLTYLEYNDDEGAAIASTESSSSSSGTRSDDKNNHKDSSRIYEVNLTTESNRTSSSSDDALQAKISSSASKEESSFTGNPSKIVPHGLMSYLEHNDDDEDDDHDSSASVHSTSTPSTSSGMSSDKKNVQDTPTDPVKVVTRKSGSCSSSGCLQTTTHEPRRAQGRAQQSTHMSSDPTNISTTVKPKLKALNKTSPLSNKQDKLEQRTMMIPSVIYIRSTTLNSNVTVGGGTDHGTVHSETTAASRGKRMWTKFHKLGRSQSSKHLLTTTPREQVLVDI